MKTSIILFITCCLVISSCDKSDENAIEQLKIDLNAGTAFATDKEDGSNMGTRIIYKDFNINNYKGCTEIILVASMESSQPDNKCLLELYNLSDSIEIQNSLISTSSTEYEWIESQNLIEYFPKKDIDLTLKFSSQNEGQYVDFRYASLYLYF